MPLDNPASRLLDGRSVVTTAGTRVQISTTPTKCRGVVVTAETDNTGVIVVGGSTVVAALATRRGTPLTAGQSLGITVNDLSLVWLDATVDTDGVTFAYTAGG